MRLRIPRPVLACLLLLTMTGAVPAFDAGSALCAEMPPAVASKPNFLRTYRFTATIKANSGVTPFKVGSKITGKFTYDLAAPPLRPESPNAGAYDSPGNSIELRCGSLRFSTIRNVRVHMKVTKPFHEGFSIRSSEWTLPEGWRFGPRPASQTFYSRDFGVALKNHRDDIRVLTNGRLLPETVLTKRFRYRRFRMDFYYGVRFPGGDVKKRAIVYADIDEIEPIKSASAKHKP